MGHDTSLVTLQFLITREIGIIWREIAMRIVAIRQGGIRIIIIVRVTIPVHIECHLVCLFQLPDTSGSQTLIAICHIISLHIYGCILATGTINTFPVGTSLGIELQILHGLVGKTFRNLPIGMTIDRHVA